MYLRSCKKGLHIRFIISVHLNAWNWTNFHDILYCVGGGNLSRKFDFVTTSLTKMTGTLHEDLPLLKRMQLTCTAWVRSLNIAHDHWMGSNIHSP